MRCRQPELAVDCIRWKLRQARLFDLDAGVSRQAENGKTLLQGPRACPGVRQGEISVLVPEAEAIDCVCG